MLSGVPAASNLPSGAEAGAHQLLDRFLNGSSRQRRGMVPELMRQRSAVVPLIPDRLAGLDRNGDDWAPGLLIQLVVTGDDRTAADQLLARHPDGWLTAGSASGLDYGPLQRQLMAEAFEQADRLTSEHLRQLAGPGALQRGYVYYSEVGAMAGLDLESLDRLWLCYSRGRFGFTVQGRLLQACGGRWERLWPRIGWKDGGVWTRYPGSFTWSQGAPEGHLPLVNQLRGVRLMDALLQHPALRRRIDAGQAPSAR
ncbi:MAG: GUN4 domain-containing protein [Cyanobacteriota bacterium]|nr:GUN4 domain-containing protein [Cyanobacteriota bacterium]